MRTITWLILVLILFVLTFGITFCVVFITSVVVLVMGALSFVYLSNEECIREYLHQLQNCRWNNYRLHKALNMMREEKRNYNLDNRLTGSYIIDEELQAILRCIFRDFVFPWYYKISNSEEFPYELRLAINKAIVTVANRVKDVDWIPYLTTQLVDDVASHLRLYKQARARIKGSNSNGDLIGNFFDLELTMEHNSCCRDHICLDTNEEKYYIHHIVEAVLYQAMSECDYHCKPVRYVTREILTNLVVQPILAKISDPDYVNQTIVWLCRDFPVSTETFLTVLKTTNNIDELYATRSFTQKEISLLRCRDAGSENNIWVKNQLSSLLYLNKIIDVRLSRLHEGSDRDSTGVPSFVDYSKLLSENKLIQLSLQFILKNSVALSYFIDYMTSIGYQYYLFAYLNMEGWKCSAKQELSTISSKTKDNTLIQSNSQKISYHLKDAAQMLYDQYLSDKVSPRLNIDSATVRTLYFRIYTESPKETWFDDVLKALYHIIETDEKFLLGFHKHVSYVKLLAELELLKEPLCKSDEEDLTVDDTSSLTSAVEKTVIGSGIENSGQAAEKLPISNTSKVITTPNSDKLFTISAKIIETGLVQECGKTFGVYALSVTKLYSNGQAESWHIYRRYSDFYELNQKLKEKFSDLGAVPFPGKKAFNNMERNVLEKRMRMLNNYMQILLQIGVIRTHPYLQEMLLAFLESREYERADTAGLAAKTFDNLLINPLKLVGNAVKTMPDNLLNTVDGVVEGFSRVFQRKVEEEEAMKVGAVLDIESDDNVPLRIMLLFMTEVFDLKTRNQWLRKRIIQLLRQIMHAMFGDIVNRRILDYVAVITSPQRVAKALSHIRNSIWPNGQKAVMSSPERSHEVRMKTRVAAKCALLASFSDELKRILGSETSRTGLMLVFSMFQHEVLNKRLMYVLLEGILLTLYPNMNRLFHKLHSTSPRVTASKHKNRFKK